jgi:phenol 2-monooxygenase
LCEWLERDPASPILKHTRECEDIDAIIDLRAVFQETFDLLVFETMPSLLRPAKGKFGLQDYEKVFCVDYKGAGDIFDMRGIDRARGCMVVIRPEQNISAVLPLDAFPELAAFCRCFACGRKALFPSTALWLLLHHG